MSLKFHLSYIHYIFKMQRQRLASSPVEIIIASRAVLLVIYISSVGRRFRNYKDLKQFINTLVLGTSAVVVFLLFELKIPSHVSSPPPSLKKKTKQKNKQKIKQATSDLQDNQYRIFAVAQVEATQKFIPPQYLKFNICDTGALFYQLSYQVNCKLNHGIGAP